MTSLFLRRLGVPLASAGATALLFTAGLWIQHTRGDWPFVPSEAAELALVPETRSPGESTPA